MGLMNKLKNMFFEEEYVEVDEAPLNKKEKPIAKKIEIPKKNNIDKKLKTKDNVVVVEEENNGSMLEEKKFDSDDDFKFKMLLDENLIVEEKKEPVKPKEELPKIPEKKLYPDKPIKDDKKIYANSYTKDLEAIDYGLLDKKVDTKIFKPSPIISPIYGVLDKNYTKEEIKDKKEKPAFSFVSSKLDVDDVRDKAFGDLSNEIGLKSEEDLDTVGTQDDIVNTEYEEDNMLDMTDSNMTPVVEKVTVGDAEEYFQDLGLEYNIDYKDDSHEVATGKRSARKKKNVTEEDALVKDQEEKSIAESENIDNKKEDDNKKSNKDKKEESVDDNLFDLIDSMYDEGE